MQNILDDKKILTINEMLEPDRNTKIQLNTNKKQKISQYIINQDDNQALQAVGDAAELLFRKGYVGRADGKTKSGNGFGFTDAELADYMGWKKQKVQQHRLTLETHGFVMTDKGQYNATKVRARTPFINTIIGREAVLAHLRLRKKNEELINMNSCSYNLKVAEIEVTGYKSIQELENYEENKTSQTTNYTAENFFNEVKQNEGK